ncbi:Crp/Fnr family transcriptional regulator [Phyllobacterium lublinensis]|uniref:Crp/Fnr family transcriptional regulator n=1 Tax=Phyllobacterium lublinensis TaxID=2875708 RepID=UPI001CC94D47|nr:Crp/Fnr family transcriptional regulator [Phyllobacterium sp. 2063]MBZ9653664.1 Crp/Fnr family transcriptional regulator [Phyllobacterium sp. 2063]
MIESLLLKLESHDVVSEDEKSVLRSLITQQKHFSVDEDLVTEGSRPSYSTLLLEGFAARYKVLEDGSRQITSLQVSGDFVDLHAFPLKIMDHGIVALTPCRVALFDHKDINLITEKFPHLTRLLWLQTLIDGAIHREWIVGMGRRSKKTHLSHLICELYVRLQVVGQTSGGSFNFPLTQSELADVMGISIVHLNKSLQMLRQENLFTWASKAVNILDWERLAEYADFNPLYLNLSIEAR